MVSHLAAVVAGHQLDFAAIVLHLVGKCEAQSSVQSAEATVAHLRADRRTSSPKVKQTLTVRRRRAADGGGISQRTITALCSLARDHVKVE